MATLTIDEQEKLLEPFDLFLNNRYRVNPEIRKIFDKIQDTAKTFKITKVWEMTFIAHNPPNKCPMVTMVFDDGYVTHQPPDFIESLLSKSK